MAKLDLMPQQAIIDGLKGSLDFYVHKGIPCVRVWPRSPGHRRAPAVEAQWPAFSYATKEWKNLSPTLKDAYTKMSGKSGLTGRDLFMRAYIMGVFQYPMP